MMKKWLNGLAALLLVLFLGSTFPSVILANTMSTLDYQVKLQADGSGIVTETRKMNLNKDTEIYITMKNLNGSTVSDFHVSDFGKPLTFAPKWNIKAGLAEKAGKYGIVTTDSGYELCWGIGDYGDHEYTVTYTLSGMVRQLNDGQALNWKLFDGQGNINPTALAITIEGPQPFLAEKTKIWGFGFEGEIHLEQGKLVGKSAKPLTDSNYVTILMQFAGAPFQPVLRSEQTLADQERIAKEGSSYGEGDRSDLLSGSLSLLFETVWGFAVPLTFILGVIGFLRQKKVVNANSIMKARERRKLNQDQYYRELPYVEGPLTDVAFMLEQLERGRLEDYFNAFLLKWLKEGSISHITEETGFIFKSDESVIQLNRGPIPGDDLESRLWNMMQSAAGEDNKLEEKEFTKWAKKHYKTIDEVKKSLIEGSKSLMKSRGYLELKKVTVLKFIPLTLVSSTPKGEDLLNRLVQFENYLTDFSLLKEREAREVIVWEDLLIWASLYGIAEAVAKQFEELYPRYLEDSRWTSADFNATTHFAHSFASGYQSGLSSSGRGGGGSTSSGGGGGSSGGGGGGSR